MASQTSPLVEVGSGAITAVGAAAAQPVATATRSPAGSKRTRFSRYQHVVHYDVTFDRPLMAQPIAIQRVRIPSANADNPMARSPPVRMFGFVDRESYTRPVFFLYFSSFRRRHQHL
jgi:hypothetical protein